MLSAFGWVVVRTSRDCYVDQTSLEDLDALDEQTEVEDRGLWASLRIWLDAEADPWFKWQLFEDLNNDKGILQFCTSRNHRASTLWPLMEWVAENGVGSYGLIYVHDDEDIPSVKHYGRGEEDFSNEFRVWRILGGKVEELDDPFLSPLVPRINPTFYA